MKISNISKTTLQNISNISKKNSKTFKALNGYDVENLYVDQVSLEERGLIEDDLLVDVEVLSSAEIGKIMTEQDVVIHH